jgi:threonine synthase
VYYFHAYGQFRELVGQAQGYPPVVFCVPTGNFGDVLAGFYAKRMGLPINKLVVATNENDIVVWLLIASATLGHDNRHMH